MVYTVYLYRANANKQCKKEKKIKQILAWKLKIEQMNKNDFID